MAISTEHQSDYATGAELFRTKIPREVLIQDLPYAIFKEIVQQVSKIMVEIVLQEKSTEILEKITPEAIANMAIAEAGAAINETLHKKMPDKIIEIENRNKEIWLQPFFGRAKRIK